MIIYLYLQQNGAKKEVLLDIQWIIIMNPQLGIIHKLPKVQKRLQVQ